MTNENQQYGEVPATPNGASLQAANVNGPSGQSNNDHSGSVTPAPGNTGSGSAVASNAPKDRSRDHISTAKTA